MTFVLAAFAAAAAGNAGAGEPISVCRAAKRRVLGTESRIFVPPAAAASTVGLQALQMVAKVRKRVACALLSKQQHCLRQRTTGVFTVPHVQVHWHLHSAMPASLHQVIRTSMCLRFWLLGVELADAPVGVPCILRSMLCEALCTSPHLMRSLTGPDN